MKTVIVGMSGGVDSSVSALLLKRQGYHVIGVFMKNWEESEESDCPAAQDYEDVAAVCHHIGIPYYSVNFSKEYWDAVFAHCLDEYRAGWTPNPDILCNKEIKFKVFLKKALELGADFLATGHYCQTKIFENQLCLARGWDKEKDQSYFLHAIDKSVLQRVLFPIGDLTKKEVRGIAAAEGLATAKKKDSTGICFIGKRNFKDFISRFIPYQSGQFQRLNGEVVGDHEGIAFYTIGQRKGLGIGGKGDAWFVVGKDPQRNIVFIEQGEDHPALYRKELFAKELNWMMELPNFPFRCTAKIRYRIPDAQCTIIGYENENLRIVFDQPQKAVTPRQSIVFYKDEFCLGGGLIHCIL
jgi:tRNA-uridine 2-sulfurtransferase